MAAFFERRARGGVGLMVTGSCHLGFSHTFSDHARQQYFMNILANGTGGVAPNRAGRVSPFASKLTYHWEAKIHRKVTEAVHRHDSKICMQILVHFHFSFAHLVRSPEFNSVLA
jgi:2,4-dienoyl-CoA reductase (NADPH2)